MSNFWKRTITGLTMVFILIASMAFGFWMFATLFLLIAIFGLWEFYSILATETVNPQRTYGTVAGALIYLSVIFGFHPDFPRPATDPFIVPLLTALPLLFLPFVIEIYRKKPQPLVNIALTLTGILYIAFPLALLNLLNGKEAVRCLQLPVILAGFFILTWFYDTGAYLYGSAFGKHKFFERISPKKTWEGTIAGALVAFATAIGLHFLAPEISLPDWLVIAFLIVLFGTFGDLAESLFKRSLTIKDSGSILPGHGGILDRFDTMFISIPFVFLYLIVRNLI
ncbi:MAG: phosphatidate cytidylyltransferase [Bacteroidales bacterium]|nr:phosphatidate cytidylyltransferase [Bacteroidales bacterium]